MRSWGLLAVVAGCRCSAPAPPPNVLLVILDDVGTDRLGAYGNVGAHTPTLDALAAGGRWYRNAWAYPTCAPSRAAIQTGRHAVRTGFGTNIGHYRYTLDPAETTLAELLARSTTPYHRVYVGKWHLERPFEGEFYEGPEAHGYDWFEGPPGNIDSYDHWLEIVRSGFPVAVDTYATTHQFDDAIRLIGAAPEPWFAIVAPNAPHPPLHAPPESLHTYRPIPTSRVGLVNATMEAVDTELGRLLASLSPEVRARTLIVVVGDNGDQLDGNERVPGTGKNTLFDAGSAVPLVITGPGVGAPGPTDALVSVVDLFPTIAAFAGIDVGGLRSITDPAQPLALDGLSLLGNLRDAGTPVHDTIAFMRFAPNGPPPLQMAASIRSTTHKLVSNGQRERLYRYHPGAPNEGQPIEDPAGEDLEALVALREQLARTVDVGNYDRR